MVSKKILPKQKGLPKKSIKKVKKKPTRTMKIGGMIFTEYSPVYELANNPERVAAGLIEALMDGDKEAFQEILEGFIKAREISKIGKKMKISRAVIYEAMDKKKNPSLSSICKIMKAFKDAELKDAA